MKRFALIALSASILLAGAPMGAPQANAASIYDNAYESTEGLIMANPNQGCSSDIDLTNEWYNIMTDVNRYYGGNTQNNIDFVQGFNQAFENGSVFVRMINEGNYKYVHVFFNPGTDTEIIWTENYVEATNVQSVQLNCVWGNGQTVFAIPDSTYTNDPSSTAQISYPLAQHFSFRAYHDDMNIPEGYEGMPIATGDTPVETDYTPKVGVYIEDKFVRGSFCMNTVQCGWPEGYTGISWRIYDTSDSIIFNSSEHGGVTEGFFELNFPSYGEYRLEADYTTQPPYLPPDNVNVYTLKMPLSINGQTYATGSGEKYQNCTDQGVCETYQALQPCLLNEAPFIDGDACFKNIQITMQLLSFKAWNWGNDWSNPNECRTLGTVGDWLGLDNKVVCASVPSSIRNIITPFITFAIGLGIIGFVVKKSKETT